jgi:hypothetical protein
MFLSGHDELCLGQERILGPRPEGGIVRLLGASIGHASLARRPRRSELHLLVD